ncbi:hypothetical protein EVAR_58130_1 [Eumeta japonica]|uniref:Uncharacterized protein n=1 Tax=Eumeta variegata TaxID=151549 RepID=A0A4C1YX66_EUMVA|nr:hypothetical protein EVAR_58130_1 [Eumeta japonica]
MLYPLSSDTYYIGMVHIMLETAASLDPNPAEYHTNYRRDVYSAEPITGCTPASTEWHRRTIDHEEVVGELCPQPWSKRARLQSKIDIDRHKKKKNSVHVHAGAAVSVNYGGKSSHLQKNAKQRLPGQLVCDENGFLRPRIAQKLLNVLT